MRIAVIVNATAEIEPKQTTLNLIRVAAERGHEVLIAGVADLSCTAVGAVTAYGRQLPQQTYDSYGDLLAKITTTAVTTWSLASCDLVLLRTNPARDRARAPQHTALLSLMRMVRDSGTLVLNDPDGLTRAASKLYLQELPASVKPLTLVSGNEAEIIRFVEELDGPAVLKPVQGTRGGDVFMVNSAQDKNLRQIVAVLLRQGLAMVQSFIPEAVHGDTRVLLMNGEILEVGGQPAAFRRIPQGSDFRSNVDVGGKTAQAIITPAMREVVAQVGPFLRRDGLFLVGLDFIGHKICEVNAYSPGGLRAAKKFEQIDFTDAVWDTLEELVNTKLTQTSDLA
jgi:glutathione synthase